MTALLQVPHWTSMEECIVRNPRESNRSPDSPVRAARPFAILRSPFTIHHSLLTAICIVACVLSARAQDVTDVAAHVPERAPRTTVLAGRKDAFRVYCTTGEGSKAFAKIKSDFDADYANFPFPAEPKTYGDPDPKKRESDQ